MSDEVYTLGMWRVKPGNQARLVAVWKEMGASVEGLAHPPTGQGILVQNVQDETLFYSFGPWRSVEDVQAMRAYPGAAAKMAELIALCDEAMPGTYRVVAKSPP